MAEKNAWQNYQDTLSKKNKGGGRLRRARDKMKSLIRKPSRKAGPKPNATLAAYKKLGGFGAGATGTLGIEDSIANPNYTPPEELVPPNEQPQQQAGAELAARNAGVDQGFVEGSKNSPWHNPVELRQPIGIAPQALPSMPGQDITDAQQQGAIAGGDLSMDKGKVTQPHTLDTLAGQYKQSVTPGGIDMSGPQGSMSSTATDRGIDAPVSSYAQELVGTQSKFGVSNDLMAQANKNAREGRMGQGSFGVAAPGALDAMAGASGYAGSSPENGGQSNVGGGTSGSHSNAFTGGIGADPAMGGGGGSGSDGIGGTRPGESLAAQQGRIATMQQWQGMDPGERGKMPQRVRDAFGLGPEPEQKAEAPRRTQEYQRQLDMRNAGVGAFGGSDADKAAAAGRQAAVGAKYAAEDQGINAFEEGVADRNLDKREIDTDAGIARKNMEMSAQQKELDRQTDERIAKMGIDAQPRFGAKVLKDINMQTGDSKERIATYDMHNQPQGIEGPVEQTEEGYMKVMLAQGIVKGSEEWNKILEEFRKKQGIK